MKRFYVFKDGMQQGFTQAKEEAIEMIRHKQKREAHPILRAEFSIIYGEEEFIPYPSRSRQPKKRNEPER